MRTKKRFSLSTTQIILLSFLAVILTGSLLLSLPFSSADGLRVPYVDALFTATSATCVTGLVTVTTATTWSLFGQVVILLLIQIGGLGVITVMSFFVLLTHRKLKLSDHLLLQDAFNLNTLSGLARFVRKVVIGTLLVETIGALLYMTVFVPRFGLRGVWVSVFNSVSAFCNAGMDIVGEISLHEYATNPLINGVTAALIVMGGIGYIVWWDVLRVLRNPCRRGWRYLTLHTKIVLSTTAILIFGGAALLLAAECNNPDTVGDMTLWNQIQVCLFQSITTRTAGFATIPQENLSDTSAMLCVFLMFVGGSPVGTAGGIKTSTLAVLVACAYGTISGQQHTVMFGRTLSNNIVRKAVAVAGMSFAIVFFATFGLAAVTEFDFLDVLYETASATATVGLSRGITAALNVWAKVILIATMYFGRIGPISLAIALGTRKEKTNGIKNPTENISVG